MFHSPDEKGIASENELKPHTYHSNPKNSDRSAKLAAASQQSNRNNKSSAQSTGSASTTVSNFMQWEAKLPPNPNNGNRKRQKVSIQNLVARIQGNEDKDVVDLSTEDKICVVMYPPTGSKFSSFKLNSSGTVLTVSFRIHQLMWDPDAVYYCIQDSATMGAESEARMDERHRRIKDSIRSHFHSKSKNGRLPREHTMTVTLKGQVDPDKSPIFIPYVFDVSDVNKDQLTFCYFEMDVFKPKMKRTPERIEIDRIVYLDTKNDGNNNHNNNNNNNPTNSTSNSQQGNRNNNPFNSHSSFAGGFGCNVNAANAMVEEEDSDYDMNGIKDGEQGEEDEDNSDDEEIAEELEATKKELEEKNIEIVLMKNELDQLREEADEMEDELIQKYNKLKVLSEQEFAQTNIKFTNLEQSLIEEKRLKFELSEKVDEMEMQNQSFQKEHEKVTVENEEFRKKISFLETDMKKHLEAGKALMKSLKNEGGPSIDKITNALVLFNTEQETAGNKRRRFEPSAAV